jgi:recombinational DNA repair protein RecR
MAAYKTNNADRTSIPVGSESQQALCRMCGRPSNESICPACADKIRAEAVANTVGDAPRARSKPGQRKAK